MHFIYKITNTVNGKIYIGSSHNGYRGIEKRWKDHIKNSKYENGYSYNYPLYKAMRKYGVENFTYEIIEKDIPTLELREAKEQLYIIQFNSLCNEGHGYNQTLDTRCPLADPRIKEKVATKLYAIDINTREEFYYDSVCDAAEECGVARGSIYQCLLGTTKYWQVGNKIFRRFEDNKIVECDITIQQRLEEYDKANPVIDGERHSIKEWCEIYNISRRTYYNRINEGYDNITALTMPKRKPGKSKK